MCLPYVSHTSPSFPICFLYLSTYFHTFPYFFPYLNPAKQQSLRGNRADRFPKSYHWATHSPEAVELQMWLGKLTEKAEKKGISQGWNELTPEGQLNLSTSVTTIRKNHLWLLVMPYSCLIIATPKQRTESGKPGNMQTVLETLFSASFWDFKKSEYRRVSLPIVIMWILYYIYYNYNN